MDERVLLRMASALAHRGPDGAGIWAGAGIGLAHRRLAVIDLENGAQPMRDGVSGKTLVYNGEIYNFRELRSELESAGERFTTDCDTEVVLKVSSTGDWKWLNRLNGMFAFALWDERRRELLLGRDRFGVKPLYYAWVDGCLLFASEIKALTAWPTFQPALNRQVVPEYVAFRALAGQETFFAGVSELPPGHVLQVSQGSPTTTPRRYWDEASADVSSVSEISSSSIEAEFAERLTDAVRYRLIADVPVGTFASGGVDSSLVTALVRGLAQGELHTFSVGFREHEHDERRHALAVAQHLETIHHELVVSGEQFADELPSAVWHMDCPIGHPNTVHLKLLSKLAKQYVTVVLTGEGADETFAGYPRQLIGHVAPLFGPLPGRFLLTLAGLGHRAGLRRVHKLLSLASDPVMAVIASSRFASVRELAMLDCDGHGLERRLAIWMEAMSAAPSRLEGALEFDRKSYLPPLLNRLDRATMAHGLEGRLPFLDYRLVLWSRTLPARFKVGIGLQNKRIVKRLASRLVPRNAVYRRKVGFGVPLKAWFSDSNELGRFLDELGSRRAIERGLWQPDVVGRMIEEQRMRRQDWSEVLWPLVNLEIWCRQFLDRDHPRAERAEGTTGAPLSARSG